MYISYSIDYLLTLTVKFQYLKTWQPLICGGAVKGCQRSLFVGLNERLYEDNAGAQMGHTRVCESNPLFKKSLLVSRDQTYSVCRSTSREERRLRPERTSRTLHNQLNSPG